MSWWIGFCGSKARVQDTGATPFAEMQAQPHNSEEAKAVLGKLGEVVTTFVGALPAEASVFVESSGHLAENGGSLELKIRVIQSL